MASRTKIYVIIAFGLAAACGGGSGPMSPSAAPSSTAPAITRLTITGLPEPLLSDIPSSIKAGRAYTLGATATFEDGSAGPLGPATVTWSVTDPTIASFDGNILQAYREGAVTITVRVTQGGSAFSRDLTVRSSAEIVREDRAERIACPASGPFVPSWFFPVYETGTIELLSVKNPGWGSASNYVTQLSPKLERINSWLLLPWRTTSVPGGFMYVFSMTANSSICGDTAAVWTRPN